MHKLLKCFSILSVLAFVACSSSDEAVDPEGYEGVDRRLWYFFDVFQQEAEARGVSVDLRASGLTGRIGNIDGVNVAGGCNFHGSAPNQIILDATFWNTLSFIQRELIVMHELGHCVLYRDHREAMDVTGRCLSIMRSGLGQCNDGYSETTREGYLNELFDPAFANEITP
ncbi:hypothetical protein BFP97_04850 [Roseivirga sp. 4D4]|uniref:hypothetical protein n=1 Tax=Roseivirga sp. 4D4 TaxID=1889784 RepID=UPI00085343AD|nr:hypothetical protein [Roseivirga sp. 4D4]OEK00878.1 hypothetical protein BFP97_04850 [Roseivirga sp. 4D4]